MQENLIGKLEPAEEIEETDPSAEGRGNLHFLSSSCLLKDQIYGDMGKASDSRGLQMKCTFVE